MRAAASVAALVAVLIAAPGNAGAHARSVSYSSWVFDERGAAVELQLSRLDHDALLRTRPALHDGARLAEHLTDGVTLRRGGRRCTVPAAPRPLVAERGWLRFEWRLHCSATGAVAITVDALFDVVAGHLHVASVATDDGAAIERVLTAGDRTMAIAADAHRSTGERARGFLWLGVEHIVGGADHLVFLLALILMAGRLRDLAGVVTGFTVGHSVTLALAATGHLTADGAAIEALIGASIALVAVENVWLVGGRRDPVLPAAAVLGLGAAAALAPLGAVPATALAGMALFAACYLPLLAGSPRPERARVMIAALFGLVHGFGFAGVLDELTAAGSSIALPLAAFNVGVELGQLAVVVLAWPLVMAIRATRWRTAAIQLASSAAFAAGVYWLVTRM